MNVHKPCIKIILNVYIHINNTNKLIVQLFIFYTFVHFFINFLPFPTLKSRQHFGDRKCPIFKGFTVN